MTNISVLLNQGKGKFGDGTWTAVTGGASCGVSADFNNDGKPDVAVITTTGASILLGTGEAKSPFTTGASIAVPGAVCMVTGDLNGDGIPDLFVAVNGSPNALLSYLGNGPRDESPRLPLHRSHPLLRNVEISDLTILSDLS